MENTSDFSNEEIEQIKQYSLDDWIDYADNEAIIKKNVRIIVKGEGSYVYDINGKKYLDACSSIFTTICGHGRKEVADAVYSQMRILEFSPSLKTFHTIPPIKLFKKIASITPGNLTRSFLVNSGSEAVEASIKIAKQYFWQRGEGKRYKIIARRNSYHGSTYGALSATGNTYEREPFGPFVPGFIHVMNAICHRCELDLDQKTCGLACLKNMEKTIIWEGSDTIAAVLIDPIPFSHAGYPLPPQGYLEGVRKLCDRYGILLIYDEIQTCFGKTGKMFACENWDIVPDILVMGKGFSGGYLPIAAATATEEIGSEFFKEPGKSLRHGHTQGGHPVACIAVLKTIEIIEKENLLNNAIEIGKYLRDGLNGNLSKYPIVGLIGGMGLLFGIILAQNKNPKIPLNANLKVGQWIMNRCYDKGVIVRDNGDIIAIVPPLNITKTEADIIINVVEGSISEAVKHFDLL